VLFAGRLFFIFRSCYLFTTRYWLSAWRNSAAYGELTASSFTFYVLHVIAKKLTKYASTALILW